MSEALDLGAVGRTLQRLVERDGRPLLLRDEATGLDHRLPAALVAASDGLMPNFLAAANVVWRAATGRHLGIEQEHDPDALLGYRVKGIRGAPFGPFVHAFLWLIAVPLALAGLVQLWAGRAAGGARAASVLGVLPVPATAVVLFAVVAAVVPRLGRALDAVRDAVLTVVPVYVLFALLAPLVGWGVARLSGLRAGEARAVAFSAATRNSLVVLPLALSVPGALPVLPAIIVAQTLVELIGELVYIRAIPRLGQTAPA